ncbi:MAG: putative periplasmic substrate-binding protein [Labilithrix sp.]|nr:putative periplasmic substrate-binding protein [Labilithrix sp.]
MRIASLLPSATEIVCILGARGELVGRSHECDHPAGIEHVPVLTSARIGPLPSSKAIDAAVRDIVKDALAIYDIDVAGLDAARPDVIVTQDLCDVCAVSLDDVRAAVSRMAKTNVDIVNLHPTRLEDIWNDIARVGAALGRAEVAAQVTADLTSRVTEIERRAVSAADRPSVLSIEWIDPVMIGGLWMPELVTLAGGTPLVTKPGDHAPTLDDEQLARLDPEVVLVKPCGFTLARTLEERAVLEAKLPRHWRAIQSKRVFVADGNAFFNRPGPRIVESLEILAACVHPELFADFAAKHSASVFHFDS